MDTIHDPRYVRLIEGLRGLREQKQVTQVELGAALGQSQSFVAKVEGVERRLDLIELLDWLKALDCEPEVFFHLTGIISGAAKPAVESGAVALPIPGGVEDHPNGIVQLLLWQGEPKRILLEGVTRQRYLEVEAMITALFRRLNEKDPPQNREAIAQALMLAIDAMPGLNPSDIYQHIVYRLYCREYRRTNPSQSWVRAGGEAVELFVERRYKAVLAAKGIRIVALLGRVEKARAISQMGLTGAVGDSKLDLALYGTCPDGKEIVFGGVHSKASLAERVSDDETCSAAMMAKGFCSILYTFDSKSFPPPVGDLVNYGELGSSGVSSDKRKYVEEHGSFDVCFCYNLRTEPSGAVTKSGKRILVSSLEHTADKFPDFVIQAWERFAKGRCKQAPTG